jgi:hypothetical protein
MPRARRLSTQTVSVLRALAAAPAGWRYGYELGQEVNLKAGSPYPVADRVAPYGQATRHALRGAW